MKRQWTALLYGWTTALALILIASVLLALLIRFSSFNEPTLSWVTLVIGLISLFLGGIVAGAKGKARGWVVGAFIGIGFTAFVFLIQYLGYSEKFSIQQTLHHLGYIGAALFGGIVGVNIAGPEHTNEA